MQSDWEYPASFGTLTKNEKKFSTNFTLTMTSLGKVSDTDSLIIKKSQQDFSIVLRV